MAGCATPTGAPDAREDPSTPLGTTPAGPAPASPATCGDGEIAGSTGYEFVTAYIEEESPYDGAVAYAHLRDAYVLRSWTDLRMIAVRNASFTGEPGVEIATIDATNGSTTWRLELDYAMPSRCVTDQDADDERLCQHWGGVADEFVELLHEAGGWTASATSPCRPSGGG